MQEIYRYNDTKDVFTSLNPLEDILCRIEGLTSTRHVKDLLKYLIATQLDKSALVNGLGKVLPGSVWYSFATKTRLPEETSIIF